MVRRIQRSAPGLSDAAIADTIRGALRRQPVSADIHVDVEHGYVTLTGHVQSLRECDGLERVVRQSPGVIGVINNMSIGASTRR